jgi:hypothetical protein
MASVSNITNKVYPEVGRTPVILAQTANNQKAAIVGLSLCNITDNAVYVSVTVVDAANVEGYYIKDILVAPKSSLKVVNGGEKLLLAPSNTIKLVSSWDAGIDALLSLVVITYT